MSFPFFFYMLLQVKSSYIIYVCHSCYSFDLLLYWSSWVEAKWVEVGPCTNTPRIDIGMMHNCVYPFLVKLWWLEGRCHFQLDRLMILDDEYDKGCHIVKSFLWGLGVQTKPPAQVTFPYCHIHIPPPKPTPWYSKNSRSKALFPLSHCFVCWVNNFSIFSLRKTNKLP